MDLTQVVLRCTQCKQTTILMNTESLYTVNLYHSFEGGRIRTDERQAGMHRREDLRLFLTCTSCSWLTDNLIGEDSGVIIENSELSESQLCDAYWYPAVLQVVKDFEKHSQRLGLNKSRPQQGSGRMTEEKKEWRKECRKFFKQKPSNEEIEAFISTYVVNADKLKDFKEIMLRYWSAG